MKKHYTSLFVVSLSLFVCFVCLCVYVYVMIA